MRINYRKTVCYFLFALTIIGTQASIAQVSEERSVVVTTAKVVEIDSKDTTESTLTQRTRHVEEVLQKKVNFHFDEDPMFDVLIAIEAKTGLNFELSRSAEQDLLPGDELITCVLKSVPLHVALKQMLSDHNATYVVQDGMVLIVSLEDHQDTYFLRTKMFDCRNLISKMEATVSSESDGAIFAAKCDSLMKAVQLTVAPESWKKKDRAGFASLHNFSGILIVTSAEDELLAVENMLVDLHARFGVTMPDRTKSDASSKAMLIGNSR